MTRTLVIARHILQESVRRRVFIVVLVLTVLFLALFTLASAEAFRVSAAPASFVAVSLDGLGMFATLFLGTVLAVFLTLGAVRGDADRGLLQPLVVRPLGRTEFLLGRFAGAASVCAIYVAVIYALVVVIVHQAGGVWPGHVVGPGLALVAGTVILVALSLLGSVLLSATANGIAMFMLYGAGLVAGLLETIGAALGAHTLQSIARDLAVALPFEALYQAGLNALGSNQSGIEHVLVTLGPFGSSHPGNVLLYLWCCFYLLAVGALAAWRFARKDL